MAEIGAASVRCAEQVGYVGAGTFEFVLDQQNRFYFMEVNCRLQVEHPVTELVTSIDLVREQIAVAAGELLSVRQGDIRTYGVAIECRINAEDPARDFLPTSGVLDEFHAPAGPFVRVDTHAVPGMRVSPYYDPLLAKVSVWAPDRAQALARMSRSLGELTVRGKGVSTTAGFLSTVLDEPLFRDARHDTGLLEKMRHAETAARQ